MLEEAPVVNDGSEPTPEGAASLSVAVRDLSIRRRINLRWKGQLYAPAGQMLGICGPTGAGKSTILALIQRHFDVTRAISASTIFR
jgi:ATP-binding cassette subfamily B multidrug efflux pump